MKCSGSVLMRLVQVCFLLYSTVNQAQDKKQAGLKAILSGKKVSMENEGQVAENYFGGGYYYLNGLKLNAGIRVARLPLALQYLRQDYFYPAHAYNNTWQVRFDREGLLDNYRRQLKERLGVDDLVPKDQLLEEAKNRTNNAVKAAMDSMKQAYTIQYGEAMEGLDTVQDYVQQDVSGQFRSILSADYSQIIKEKEARLKQLLEKRGGSLKERQEASKLQKEIAAYYKLVDFYKRYQELRKQYDLSGLNKQLVQEQAERLRRYEKMMDDPESVKELAAKHLPQSGLEKFFMNVQKLNLGQQTVSLSPLSLNSYLHSGVSMEVLKDNKYLFLLVGKERDLNALYDRAVFSPLTQNDHTASGIRVGRGALDGNHTHLSLFSFKQSGALTEGRTFDMPSRSTLVLGLSNRFNIDESSSLQLEVSRSATVYDQAAYGSDTTGRKSALGRLFSNDNLGQSIALMLKYRGNFDKAGLNIGADVTYVAAGYYNPGSPFLARGTRQGMLSVRKSWWKRKLVLQLRGDLREYVYGNLTDRKWQHFSYLADARLKLPGGQQLSLKYQPVRGVQVMPGTRLLQNASDRVTVKLNLQRRVGQAFYRNMFNIAYSSSRYLLATQYTGVKTLTFTSLQSIAITGHLLYWNNTYNYARNPDGLAYLNSSYNTDAGFTWQLGKKWSASSALNYTSATGWYKQLGARQTLTAMVIRNLDLSFFIDVRTNIEQSAAYYNDLIRADWSLKYNF